MAEPMAGAHKLAVTGELALDDGGNILSVVSRAIRRRADRFGL